MAARSNRRTKSSGAGADRHRQHELSYRRRRRGSCVALDVASSKRSKRVSLSLPCSDAYRRNMLRFVSLPREIHVADASRVTLIINRNGADVLPYFHRISPRYFARRGRLVATRASIEPVARRAHQRLCRHGRVKTHPRFAVHTSRKLIGAASRRRTRCSLLLL